MGEFRSLTEVPEGTQALLGLEQWCTVTVLGRR